MWAPVDATALPTAKELTDAKIAIEQVESEFKDAQLRVANLEKDLKARRAWIAPIRRLSFDVLSLIFEFCGEDSWKTPLRISGVSRQWRHLALATPRAWAFLHVDECEHNRDLVDHYFKYSGHRPLHVFLHDSHPYDIISSVAERLECLSIEDGCQIEEGQCFPKLERLMIRDFDARVAITDLGISRFPALRELICEPIVTPGTVSLPTPMKVAFPPLQTLSLTVDGSIVWLGLLITCRSSLVSLRLHVAHEYPDSQPEVHLPLLKCLEIYLWSGYPEFWPIDMKTPAIEMYIEATKGAFPPTGTAPIHRNIGSVTRMRISYTSNLSGMSSLRILQLEGGGLITDVLSQLQLNRTLCPRLELIEIMQGCDLAPFGGSLAEVNRGRSQTILMRYVETRATALPYEISRFPVNNLLRTYTSSDVPSSAGQTCRAVENTPGRREIINS